MKHDNKTRRDGKRRGAGLLWVAVLVAVVAGGGFALWGGEDGGNDQPALHLRQVERQDLRVSVLESGQMEAANSIDIYNEIKGSTTILRIIDEGEWVQEGDLLVELDSSDIEDRLTAQRIRYEQANASFIQAQEAVAIQESLNGSNISKAELALDLARTDLTKYLEGDWLLKQEQAASDITLAEEELKTAEKTMDDTKELVDLNFEALTTLERDTLAFRRAELKLAMNRMSQEISEKYEHQRQLQVLQSDVEQNEAELERVKRRAHADLAQKTADLRSKQATLDLEKDKLTDLEEQQDKARVMAPASGLVVYPANSSSRRGSDRSNIEEGATVRERQLLVSLPDTSRMTVSVQIHESAVDMVEVGRPAVVTVDAFAGKVFYGKVTFVSPLPDSTNSWLNPDLKVYRSQITLAGETEGLRPGMSASAEIVIDELLDVLVVPVHAVYRKGSHYYCYLDQGGDPVIREVTVGLHNDAEVEIKSGLEEGDLVYLAAPPTAPEPDFPEEEQDDVRRPSMDSLEKQTEGVTAVAQKETEAGGASDFPAFDWSSLQGMSEEERKAAMKAYMDKLTPEQKAQLQQRFGGGRGGRGGGGGQSP